MRGVFNLTEFKETTNTIKEKYNRQTLGAKILSQKGNSPDYFLKSLIFILVIKD